jgi:serine/threonine-protein kinase HipA
MTTNPPGLPVEGRSIWVPGKALERFLQTRCNVMAAQVKERTERICEAIVRVIPRTVEAAGRYPLFTKQASGCCVPETRGRTV